MLNSTQNPSPTPGSINQRGFALVSALVLIALLTVVGVAVLSTTDIEVQTSANQRASTQAFYIAEAGLHRAMAELKEDPLWLSSISDTSDAFAGDNTLPNGYYNVEVFKDTPELGQVTIRSTGHTGGFYDSEATVQGVGKQTGYPKAFKYVLLNCGKLDLQGNSGNVIEGDLYVGGNLKLHANSNNVVAGNVESYRGITVQGGQIQGNITSNESIKVDSIALPPVTGDATSGNSVTGLTALLIGGTVTENVSPDPVENLCAGTTLATIAVTAEEIQNYRDNADETHAGNHSLTDQSISGVVHVTGDMAINGNLDLQDNTILIVDGDLTITGPGAIKSSPAGASATLFVPNGNIYLEGGGILELDGNIHVGTVFDDGTLVGTADDGQGDLFINNSTFTVNGSVVLVNGQFHSQGSSSMAARHVVPTDEKLIKEDDAGFDLEQWREKRN